MQLTDEQKKRVVALSPLARAGYHPTQKQRHHGGQSQGSCNLHRNQPS